MIAKGQREGLLSTLLSVTVLVLMGFSIWVMTGNMQLRGDVKRLAVALERCQQGDR
jgi:hypothetical protein